MTRPSMQVAIDALEVDLGERLRLRVEWGWIGGAGFTRADRARDIAAIRGYIRAIRVLREAER